MDHLSELMINNRESLRESTICRKLYFSLTRILLIFFFRSFIKLHNEFITSYKVFIRLPSIAILSPSFPFHKILLPSNEGVISFGSYCLDRICCLPRSQFLSLSFHIFIINLWSDFQQKNDYKRIINQNKLSMETNRA